MPLQLLLVLLLVLMPGAVLPGAVLPGAVLPGAVLPGAALPGVFRSGPAAGVTTPSWDYPVEGERRVIRPFIAPATRYAAGHRGIDLATEGAILAPADGVVRFAGVVFDRPVLSIDHPGGLISSYEPVTTVLRKGDAVRRGQVTGTVLPGHCSGLCVHFGVRLDGEYVSPLTLVDEIDRSVLLPTRSPG